MYSTVANVKSEAGMTNNTNITDALVTGYITQADAEIDGVLIKRYTLPLTETIDLVEFISRQLAAGLLLCKEYGYEDNLSEAGREKKKNARDMLKMLSEKKMSLVKSDGSLYDSKSQGTINYNPTSSTTTKRKFTMGQQF